MDAIDLARENALLKARLTEVEAALAEVQEANRRLEDILRTAQREKFGKRSEKLSPDQFNLPLEDAELAQGVLEAAQEKAGVCQTSCPPISCGVSDFRGAGFGFGV